MRAVMLLHHPRFARWRLLCSLRGQWRPIGIKWYYKGSTSALRAHRPSLPHRDTTFYPSFGGRRAILQGWHLRGPQWPRSGKIGITLGQPPTSRPLTLGPLFGQLALGVSPASQYPDSTAACRLLRQSPHAKRLRHCRVGVRGPLLP